MAIPSNPTNLILTPGVNKIGLTWGTSAGATGYKIYRSEDGVSYTLIATQPGVTYEDKRLASSYLNSGHSWTGYIGLERNKQYYYKVTAYNVDGESSGTIASTTTIADSAYSGTVRAKAVINLICDSTDHMAVHPTKAQIQILHDWIRANVTTKINLFVSRRILYATTGEDLNILNYLKTLVTSYNYDIVTLPHSAWLPTTPAWSAGIANEVIKIQEAHDKCFSDFGKYPVACYAWGYSNDLIEKAISLGYKIVSSQIREQSAMDGYTCMGVPFQLYKPSKRCIAVPGDGTTANTYDVIAGLTAIQWGTYRLNPEPLAGDVSTLGVVDSNNDFFSLKNQVQQLMENSPSFNDFVYLPCYIDPAWMFMEVNGRSGIILPNGDTEMLYLDKQMLLWYKDRYATLMDFVSVSELATYAQTVITNASPMPTFAIDSQHDYEGHDAEKGLRYESQHYHALMRHKAGLDGYIKLTQYAGYNTSLDEPSGLANDWSVPGMYRRTNTNPVKDIKFVAGGVTHSLTAWQTGYGHVNIHAPVKKVTGETLEMAWDVYDATDTTRLLSTRFTFAPEAYTVSFNNADKSVSKVTVITNSDSPVTTLDVPFTYNGFAVSISLPRHFNAPLNSAALTYSGIAQKIYSDATCTVEDATLGQLTPGQVNIVDRYIWNESGIPIAVQLYDSGETLGIVTYSWDGVIYADPTAWHLLSPGEKHNFKCRVDLTTTSTAESFFIGKRVRG